MSWIFIYQMRTRVTGAVFNCSPTWSIAAPNHNFSMSMFEQYLASIISAKGASSENAIQVPSWKILGNVKFQLDIKRLGLSFSLKRIEKTKVFYFWQMEKHFLPSWETELVDMFSWRRRPAVHYFHILETVSDRLCIGLNENVSYRPLLKVVSIKGKVQNTGFAMGIES